MCRIPKTVKFIYLFIFYFLVILEHKEVCELGEHAACVRACVRVWERVWERVCVRVWVRARVCVCMWVSVWACVWECVRARLNFSRPVVMWRTCEIQGGGVYRVQRWCVQKYVLTKNENVFCRTFCVSSVFMAMIIESLELGTWNFFVREGGCRDGRWAYVHSTFRTFLSVSSYNCGDGR
jgi:hypothetical protein